MREAQLLNSAPIAQQDRALGYGPKDLGSSPGGSATLFQEEKKVDNLMTAAAAFIGLIVLVVVFSMLFAFPVMWLWNWIIPGLLGGSIGTLTWGKAWGLMVLCGFLFKSTNYNNKS